MNDKLPRLMLVAAAALLLCLLGGSASGALKRSCVISSVTFNHSYIIQAVRTCKVGGKTVAVSGGHWSWSVQTGDDHGYLGPLGPSHGTGSVFTLPVAKLAAGVRGYNPPGYVKVTFNYSVKWGGVLVKAPSKSQTWTTPNTSLHLGVLPKSLLYSKAAQPGSTNPPACAFTVMSDGQTWAKVTGVTCTDVGGNGHCTLVPEGNEAVPEDALLNRQEVHCPGVDGQTYVSRFVLDVNYTTTADPTSATNPDCSPQELIGVTSYAARSTWGSGQLWYFYQMANYTNPDHFPDGSKWISGWLKPLSGNKSPCNTDWQ